MLINTLPANGNETVRSCALIEPHLYGQNRVV
ncbi:hypothetical protein CF65_01272 [Aggregatibacter actinomycetemcomitans HK1651]|nr:hypothetical protein CF65_01272 [Aggregatibacter actinomycetemcomitans HK1651]